MGNFEGHVLAGSILLFFGLSWAVKHTLKFFSQTAMTSLHPKKVIYMLDFVEWSAMLCANLLGIIVGHSAKHGPGFQLFSVEEHKWNYLHIWQHSTMYLFFGMAAVVGLLTVSQFRIPLGLDRLMLSLALFNEGIILYFHIAQRPPLDYHIHFMMNFAIFSTAFCSLFEVFFRDHPILELFRASMFLTQGSWKWQIAFVLFPRWGAPSWDQNDHANIKFITMCFSWHYAAAVLLMSIIYSIIYCLCKRLEKKYGAPAIETEMFGQAREAYTILDNMDED